MTGLIATLVRRWPMVLVLILTMGALGFAVTLVVPAEYETKSTIALIPPSSRDNPNGNRYLLLGGLNPARDILIKSLESDQTRELIVGHLDGADYDLEPDFTTSAPVIVATVTAVSRRDADEVLDGVLTSIPDTLTFLQNEIGTAAGARIESLEVARDEEAQRTDKNQVRAVIAVVGAVGVMGVLLIGALDGLWMRRRQRKTSSVVQDPSGSATSNADRPQPVETDHANSTDARNGSSSITGISARVIKRRN